MGSFVLIWKEFLTHPTFVFSPLLMPSTACQTLIPLFFGTPCTTENCYIETLRTSDNSDNWDAIFTDLHTVLWSVWPKRIIKLSAKWFLTQHVYLRLKSRLQDIPLLIYQIYFYGPPLLNTHFGPYFIIY